MNLLVIGLNHRSAPVAVRERLAFPRAHLGEATCLLLGAAPLAEAAIVSTCNRVEIYALVPNPAVAGPAVRRFLGRRYAVETVSQLWEAPPTGADGAGDAPSPDLESSLYEFVGPACPQHLLEVVCGLDSMVVGETEILGQVKEAYAAAQTAGATGAALNRLFQKAFAAAKHIRTNTAITRGSVSVGSVAVDLATQIFQDLASRTVMIIGTGEISEATARSLRSRGAGTLLVCSRHAERARALADELQGRPISYEQWETEFPHVDIAIAATAAPHPILTPPKLAPLMDRRRQRALFLIDIAVPRNIDRACGDLENVYLYDIDDLQGIAQQNLAARQREIASCRTLVGEHTNRFWEWFTARVPSLAERFKNRPTPPPAAPPNAGTRPVCFGRGKTSAAPTRSNAERSP